MDTAEIRRTFLDFFKERDHTILPSSSLVPQDPTLLLTNAGMVQFKPFFLGESPPPYRRAATCQKCFRTIDLEIVGTTSRHMTFFEMLGNFSFGDYFKSEACRWGWELLTEGYGLDAQRLWVTVYETDDDAARIWEDEVGVPASRILRRREDNFWDMGVAGPCGPCSELLYDRGEDFGKAFEGGELDEERYLEVWNLVFIQNLRDEEGNITGELSTQNVDTGLGLARLAAILQDVPTSFEIDTMAPILRRAEEITGSRYLEDHQTDVSLRVLTEHARAITFLIADGVMPSNEARGYVLRRLIRRAIRYARKAGVQEAFLGNLVETVFPLFEDYYPELPRNRELVEKVTQREEERFDATLRQGLQLLEQAIDETKESGQSSLDSDLAFKLYDTYGFPLELTEEIASEEGLSIDRAGFDVHMTAQRERARSARREDAASRSPVDVTELVASAERTEFLGYETLSVTAGITGLIEGDAVSGALEEGSLGRIVLNTTSFYPEGGGQIGDRGLIRTDSGTFTVSGTTWGAPGVIVHSGVVTAGEIRMGEDAVAEVDPNHRRGVTQSHTATHMLHWALRRFLGDHARQSGSLVEPGRLRFDFSHFEAVSPDDQAQIEKEINRRVLDDDPVRAFETSFEYATSTGAMALFGEKYGDVVRVVEVGDYSKELCGGTHVARTGQVGVVKLLGEGSVAAGTRRIESYTGEAGLEYLNSAVAKLVKVAETLKVDPSSVQERLESLLSTIRALEEERSKWRASRHNEDVETVLRDSVTTVGSSKLVVVRRDGYSVDEMRRLAVDVRDRIGSALVVVGAVSDGKGNIVAAGSRDLVERGVAAGELLKEGGSLLGGGGGGKPELAIAGGPRTSEIEAAVTAVEKSARKALEAIAG